ncbi:MAG: phosphoadenosine phosphosulfate reductase family protein [Candidatus Dehalobacter alkaniphilus]
MKVCWFSAGVSSFIAAYLVRDTLDKIIYCHIDNQHPDTLRFVKDCEKALGIPIEIIQSKYKSVENVIQAFQFVNSRYGAKCTDILKKRVRKEWEYEQGRVELTYVWGYDCTEKHRAERIEEADPDHIHEFPLIERGLTKEDVHGMLKQLGIKRPAMYDLGYRNNNCVGCVKGGMGYWNKIRVDFPEVFERRAKQEREIGHTCIKGVYLDELDPKRGRIEDEIMDDCSIACQINLNYESEEITMATTKGLLQKIQILQEEMASHSWEKDGINRHQSYKYVTEKQYKQVFKAALRKAGLIWKMETLSHEFIPAVSDKMHLVLCQFRGQLIDPDTGEREEYLFSGSGADNGDKALYKAVTGGHKFFLAGNFNVAEDNDPENDTDDVPKPVYTSPEKREEVKENLLDKDGVATKMQITSLKKALKLLREADPSQEEFIAQIAEKTENFTKIKKKACEELILKIGEMTEAAANGGGSEDKSA